VLHCGARSQLAARSAVLRNRIETRNSTELLGQKSELGRNSLRAVALFLANHSSSEGTGRGVLVFVSTNSEPSVRVYISVYIRARIGAAVYTECAVRIRAGSEYVCIEAACEPGRARVLRVCTHVSSTLVLSKSERVFVFSTKLEVLKITV